jgi:hypothetical protein
MVAIYVVVKDGQWHSAGHNSGGYEVDQVVALGPEVTLRYIDALGPMDAADADDFWSSLVEGGALIDMDAQRLLVWSRMLDAGQRAAFLDALTRTWPGWHIDWAFRDAWDLADYPGVTPPARPDHIRPTLSEVTSLTASGSYLAPVTVADRGGVRAYEMSLEEGEPWLVGPRILDLLREDLRCTALEAPPLCGMHVDIGAKAVGLWTVETWTGLREAWPELWPEWSLQLWDDRFSEQVTRAAGSLTLPDIDVEEERRTYGERLDELWLESMAERAGESDFVDLPQDDYHRLRRSAIGS